MTIESESSSPCDQDFPRQSSGEYSQISKSDTAGDNCRSRPADSCIADPDMTDVRVEPDGLVRGRPGEQVSSLEVPHAGDVLWMAVSSHAEFVSPPMEFSSGGVGWMEAWGEVSS
jgi:hypothetical protein